MLATIIRRTLPVQCPACREHLGKGPKVAPCAICQTAHHEACLVEIGCSSLNCATPGGRVGDLGAESLELPLGSRGSLAPVVNLCDISWLAEDHTPMLMWLCAGAPHYFLCESFANGVEEMAQWASENAPGLLTAPEYPDDVDAYGRCGECRGEDDPTDTPCPHTEEAEEDLTYCDPGLWVASWEWGGGELHDADMLTTVRTWAIGQILAEDHEAIVDAISAAGTWVEGCECGEHCEEDCGGSVDVRLQFHNGRWSFHSGDSSFDSDGRGYWGASSVTGEEDITGDRATADDLISQVLDQSAQG